MRPAPDDSLTHGYMTDQRPLQPVAAIPALTHAEAMAMAAVELDRFLALVDSLGPDDWRRPTACTRWDVRQVLAHVTGAAAGFARWSEFRRQNNPRLHRRYRQPGDTVIDRINAIQVADRADRAPAALIAELREVGPRAIATRRRLPAPLRAVRLPMPPPIGRVMPIGYLTDLIYTRDLWMHRLDIARATGRPMVLTAEHDGRVTALVVRDLAHTLAPLLGDASLVYALTGLAGGAWLIGDNPAPAAVIQMDALDFNLLASGRLAPADLLAGGRAVLSGDLALAERALAATSVPY